MPKYSWYWQERWLLYFYVQVLEGLLRDVVE